MLTTLYIVVGVFALGLAWIALWAFRNWQLFNHEVREVMITHGLSKAQAEDIILTRRHFR